MVDESAAFRQLPACPDSRGVAVVGVCEPMSGQVAFFSMLAHPFGLTQSVFNYNRRGCLLTSILVKSLLLSLSVVLPRQTRSHGEGARVRVHAFGRFSESEVTSGDASSIS